ncbi:MAG: hypothetical protein LBL66_09735 [Clostridiales bacterium]|jgi:hypothetical protein|nr:hypothetical protein [Clostridiales bacterium]
MDYSIFNLPDGAPFDDVTAAYQRLKAQYSEDRFAEGERGNDASRRLMELEQAYAEASFRHASQRDAEKYGHDYGAADDLIKRGKLDEAQAALDATAERTGEWHYLQSIIFYKRGWFAESKKQLRLACSLEPDNAKFQSANQKMDAFTGAPPPRPGAGGYGQQGQGQGQYGPNGRPAPPPERNIAYDNCCLEACCCANCLYCCTC